MKKGIHLLLLLCVLGGILPAQTYKWRFRHYTIEDGLCSNSVRALLEDCHGYIWIGTDAGLTRFDGVRMTNYQKRNTGGVMPNNSVIALLQADDCRLYIGTEDGICTYDYRSGAFKPFAPQIHTLVNALARDRKGYIWAATGGEGIWRIDPKTMQTKRYRFGVPDETAYYLLTDHAGRLWATGLKAFYLYDARKDRFEPFPLGGIPNMVYTLALYEDAAHTLWVGTWQGDLIRIHADRRNYDILPANKFAHQLLHIHSITAYRPGVLLIGSDQGLMLYDIKQDVSRQFLSDEKSANSLSDRFIYPIIKDREGGLWAGTYYGGVNYVPPFCDQFEGYGPAECSRMMPGKVISRFCEDGKGNVWTASDDGGVGCFSMQEHAFTDYPGRAALQRLNAHALCFCDGKLWIGTYSDGMIIFDPATGHIVRLKDHQGPIQDQSIYALMKDREGRIWMGAMSKTFVYNPATKQFSLLHDLGHLTIDIREDHQGRIWFATQGGGLYRFTPATRQWRHYGAVDGLPTTYVNSICINARGQILLGTAEGLYSYLPSSDRMKYHELPIPNESVSCIIEDGGRYWLTTARGLAEYTPGKGVRLFTASDGLQSDNFIMASGLRTTSGRIFAGTINGLNVFTPCCIRTNRTPPIVTLTGLEISNQEVTVGPDGPLPAPIDQLREIHLSHTDNVISLLYAALSYCTPQKNSYAYRLEGFDKGWNYVGNQTKAVYTNLPAGTYTFRVKAANNDGLWNNRGASIRIIVHPPWYLSLPMKLLYVLMAVLALYLLLRYLLRRNELRHQEELDRISANREKEVQEAKIAFFTIIAHEIRTPVSLIIGPLEKIMQSVHNVPEPIMRNISIIDRNSKRLLNLINQLLDFRKVEQRHLTLRFVTLRIRDLLQQVIEGFQPSLEQQKVELSLSVEPEDLTVDADREALTKIVSNLIGNALKYTHDRIDVEAHADTTGTLLRLSIRDNGHGMSSEELTKIFQPFYQASGNLPGTGIGLSIVKGLAEAHQGHVLVTSTLNEGSEFVVTLPLTVHKEQLATDNEPLTMDKAKAKHLDSGVTPASAKTDAGVTPASLLLVDDNHDILDFLSDTFSDTYTIATASDGVKALDYLKHHPVSVVVSDWMMPRMDGPALCRALRNDPDTSHLPFIMLTAKTDVDSKVAGMKYGADLYIEKPFSPEYLDACIRGLLERRAALRREFSQVPAVAITTITESPSDKEFLSHLNNIVESRCQDATFNVDVLAQDLCMSRSSLFAKIKGVADVTPNEMIQIIRLKKAAALLAEHKYQISEICFKVGFNSPSYFSKCFQKQFGLLPTDYAKSGQPDAGKQTVH